MASSIDPQAIRRMAVMWADIVSLQAERLRDAVDEMLGAATDHQLREQYEKNGGPDEWGPIVSEATRVLTWRTVWTVGADKYFFLLAVAQLDKCVDDLPDDGLQKFPQQQLLRGLRNVEEHWEDRAGPSITKLREAIPDIVPGRLTYNNKHVWLEGESVAEIVDWAMMVAQRLRDNAAATGEPLPEAQAPV